MNDGLSAADHHDDEHVTLAESVQDMDSLLSGSGDEMDESDNFLLVSCELNLLLEKFDEERVADKFKSSYGNPLSPEEAANQMPAGRGGMIWYATLIEDHFLEGNKKIEAPWNKKDFDIENGQIKPCRPSLPVFFTDFFSSLVEFPGPNGANRYVFHGVLNGWPSLTTLELVGIQRKRMGKEYLRGSVLMRPKKLMSSQRAWSDLWSSEKDTQVHPQDVCQAGNGFMIRLKLRGPTWSSKGWSKDSPGYCFWFEQFKQPSPTLSYGTNMINIVDKDAVCSHLHMVSHRYAIAHESPRDKLTYHSIVLLEWNHGRYCTVVETAYLNGLGGYKGKSNFHEDRDSQPWNSLLRSFPPEMIGPWFTNAAEIRCHDVPARNFEEFKEFMSKHEGRSGRFVDPHYSFSHPARLTFRTKAHIAQYLVNYISRDFSYSEIQRNCQTFAADLCSFLGGKKGVTPFHPVNRVEYKNKNHLFLYDSCMYSSDKVLSKVIHE